MKSLPFAILVTILCPCARAQGPARECLRSLLGGGQSVPQNEWIFKFDSSDRTKWNFIPLRDPRNQTVGARIDRLPPAVLQKVRGVMETVLSPRGFATTENVRNLDEVLHNNPALIDPRFVPGDYGQNEYNVAIFGEPANGPWALRIQGHHLSVNATFNGDELVSMTPLFLGEYPQIVFLRTLDEAGRTLANHLSARGVGGVDVHASLPHRIFLVPANANKIIDPLGVAYANLSATEMQLFDQIFTGYLANLADPIRAELLQKFADAKSTDPSKVYFYWMGSLAPNEPYHFYLQINPGEGLTLEFQNIDGHHVHSVLRDFANDFGSAKLPAPAN